MAKRGGGWGAADAAAGEGDHGVGVGGVGEVVGGEQHGASGVGLGSDDLEDPLLGPDVETGRGFVEEQHRGLLGDALSDEGPLALTARELVDGTTAQIEKADSIEGLVTHVPVGAPHRPEEAPGRVAAHTYDIVDSEPELGIDGGGLQDIGDRTSGRDRSRRRPEAAADQREHRRLAGAIGADDRGDGPGLDREAHLLQGECLVVVGINPLELHDRRA